MDSGELREDYSEFEPDANEIMFGQRKAPDRPLTVKELSKRRKIILKIVDQKLKSELAELMRLKEQQQQNASISNLYASSNPPVNRTQIAESTSGVVSSSHYDGQHLYRNGYPGQGQSQRNFPAQLENDLDPAVYSQQYQMTANAASLPAQPTARKRSCNTKLLSTDKSQTGLEVGVQSTVPVFKTGDTCDNARCDKHFQRESTESNSKNVLKFRNYSSEAARNLHICESKIANILNQFLYPGENYQELISQLMENPHILEENAVLRNRISKKGQTVHDIMKDIKFVLDDTIKARRPRKVRLSPQQFTDVPFVVNLYDKIVKMTRAYAIDLTQALIASIKSLKIFPKPKLRNIKFTDGSLVMVCVNRMSLDWLENAIANHLAVKVLPFKNVITKKELKTICIKFERPQYFHFNYLMEQLRNDNPRLLTTRWELRSPLHNNVIDSTKCIYVGVDVESLINLEGMDRVGVLRGSSISFEICYDVNEENYGYEEPK